MIRQRVWLRVGRILSVLLFVMGAQWLVYEHRASALEEQSQTQLAALRLEVVDNREANAALRALQDAWNATTNEEQRRDFVALRDRVTERFLMDREAAMTDFVDTVKAVPSVNSRRELETLSRHAARLAGIYSNRSAVALEFVDRGPWYVQPTAQFLGGERRKRLQFNAALQSLLLADLETSLSQFVELRERGGTTTEIARIDYALARLHYARYTDEQAVDGLTAALGFVQASLRNAPDAELSLLLLDYLLAMDRTVNLVEMETFDGEGAGQGDGERGAVSGSADKF